MDSDSDVDDGPLSKQIISLVLKEFTPYLIGILVINLVTIFLVVQISKRIPF
jgi:hypothetical protein